MQIVIMLIIWRLFHYKWNNTTEEQRRKKKICLLTKNANKLITFDNRKKNRIKKNSHKKISILWKNVSQNKYWKRILYKFKVSTNFFRFTKFFVEQNFSLDISDEKFVRRFLSEKVCFSIDFFDKSACSLI